MKKIEFKKAPIYPIWLVVVAVAIDVLVSILQNNVNDTMYFISGILSVFLLVYGGVLIFKYYNKYYITEIDFCEDERLKLLYNSIDRANRGKQRKSIILDSFKIQIHGKKIEVYSHNKLVGRTYKNMLVDPKEWDILVNIPD